MCSSDLITRRNTIDWVDPITLQSSIPFIFTGGDSATGASLVVEAIGGGRRAARSIHQYLNEEPVVPPEDARSEERRGGAEGEIRDARDV